MKIISLIIITILAIGCASTDRFILTAHDSQNPNKTYHTKYIVNNSTIYTARDDMCMKYPNAIIVIKDKSTNEELSIESPYQCDTKISSRVHYSFILPNNLKFMGNNYNIAFKQQIKKYKIFEYTTNKENMQKWTSLITISYLENINLKPLQWLNLRGATLKKSKNTEDYEFNITGDNTYVKTFFKVGAKNPYYEVNIQKSFHSLECGGVVLYQFAKRYNYKPELKVVKKDYKYFSDKLETNNWQPNCKASLPIVVDRSI